jgi:hypothetical protein
LCLQTLQQLCLHILGVHALLQLDQVQLPLLDLDLLLVDLESQRLHLVTQVDVDITEVG